MAGTNPAVVAVFARALTTFSQAVTISPISHVYRTTERLSDDLDIGPLRTGTASGPSNAQRPTRVRGDQRGTLV